MSVLKVQVSPGVWEIVGVGGTVEMDSRYVNIPGDTMTGDLIMKGDAPTRLRFQDGAGVEQATLRAYTEGGIKKLKSTSPVTVEVPASYYGYVIHLQDAATPATGFLIKDQAGGSLAAVNYYGSGGAQLNDYAGIASTLTCGSYAHAAMKPNGLYVYGGPSGNEVQNLVLGESGSTGPRIRLCVPGSGNICYIDYAGWGAAGTEMLIFRASTTNVLALEDTLIRGYKAIYCQAQVRCTTPAIWGTGDNAYVQFFGNASSVDSVGTRSGYIGFPASNHLYVNNETGGGFVILRTAAGAGSIDFYTNAAYQGRMTQDGDFLVAKTALNTTSIGVGVAGSGRVYSTTGSATSYNYLSNIVSAVDNNVHMSLRRSDVIVGSILMNGTAGVTYATSSDGRFKHVLDDITDTEAIERVMAYRPVKYQWKLDVNQTPKMDGKPGGKVEWGLIAQEAMLVNDVATNAGVGEPHQIDFEMMSMDYGRITPDLLAAIQALVHRVEALEAR